VKFNTAALVVPLFVTLALPHGADVVVVHTVIVAASQVSPLSPLSHLSQVSPFSHCGQVRVVLASANVTVLQSVSPNTILFQLNAAELILAQVAHVSH
jgi:hypothetical protein